MSGAVAQTRQDSFQVQVQRFQDILANDRGYPAMAGTSNEDHLHRFPEMTTNSFRAPAGAATYQEVHNYMGVVPPNRAWTARVEPARNPTTRVLACSVDDLFESVPLDGSETRSRSPPPAFCGGFGGSVQAHANIKLPQASIRPPPGLEFYAGAGGAWPAAACESPVKAWKQPSQDSLATISTCSGLEEQEDLDDEELPKKTKKRFCKAKRDRYRRLVEGLVLQAKSDPSSFDLSAHKLPPAIAASEAAQVKLLATVLKFAAADADEVLPAGIQWEVDA